MKKKIITITGDLASGKSSVGKTIRDRIGWEVFTIGILQREKAEEMGMDTNAFNTYMNIHPEIDTELDQGIIQIGTSKERVIVDSRLAWHWIPDSLKVFLKVDIEEAARRVFNDTNRTSELYHSVEEARTALKERKQKEVERLLSTYGVDFSDELQYDLVIDTTRLNKEQTVEVILEKAKESGLL